MGMQEETYYSDGTNWITNQRLIFGDAKYPLGDAISVQMKATYPQKVMLARVAIIVSLVILFGLVAFLQGKSDPLFGPIITAANIIAIVGGLVFYAYMVRADYLKQPSFRKGILNIALFMLIAPYCFYGLSSLRRTSTSDHSGLSALWSG